MNFTLSQISFANLNGHGFNAIHFSIMGMLIVFGGLTLISIYIALLPKILALPDLLVEKVTFLRKRSGKDGTDPMETELLIAMAIALHLDLTRTSQRITWKRQEREESPWRAAGRIRGLAVRSHLPRRRPGA